MTLEEAPALSGDHSFHEQHAFTAQIEDELNVTLQHQSASLVNESSSSSNVSMADTDFPSSHDLSHDSSHDEEHASADPVEPDVYHAEAQETEHPESPEKQQVHTSWLPRLALVYLANARQTLRMRHSF